MLFHGTSTADGKVAAASSSFTSSSAAAASSGSAGVGSSGAGPSPLCSVCVGAARLCLSARLLCYKQKRSGANTQTHNVCRRPADPTELLLCNAYAHTFTLRRTHPWHSRRLIAALYRRHNVSAAPLRYISDLSTLERASPALAHAQVRVFFLSPGRIMELLRGREQPGECFRASSRIKWKAAL